jgi:hypothetical protein
MGAKIVCCNAEKDDEATPGLFSHHDITLGNPVVQGYVMFCAKIRSSDLNACEDVCPAFQLNIAIKKDYVGLLDVGHVRNRRIAKI